MIRFSYRKHCGKTQWLLVGREVAPVVNSCRRLEARFAGVKCLSPFVPSLNFLRNLWVKKVTGVRCFEVLLMGVKAAWIVSRLSSSQVGLGSVILNYLHIERVPVSLLCTFTQAQGCLEILSLHVSTHTLRQTHTLALARVEIPPGIYELWSSGALLRSDASSF